MIACCPRARLGGALAAVALLVFTAAASAMERFVLKDERTIDGKVLGESDTTLIVRTADGTVTIEKKEVVRREDAPVAGAAGGGFPYRFTNRS